MEKLTKREKQVIIELLKNGRVSDQEIARRIKTSRPTIVNIRHRLERKGIIKGYDLSLNFEKIGLRVHAITLLTWNDYSRKKDLEKINKYIISLPCVVTYIRGQGIGSMTKAIISIHRDLQEYEIFMGKLQEKWAKNVNSVEVFLSSIEGAYKNYDFKDNPLEIFKEDSNK